MELSHLHINDYFPAKNRDHCNEIKTIYNESNAACTFVQRPLHLFDTFFIFSFCLQIQKFKFLRVSQYHYSMYLLKPITAKISIIEPTMSRLSLLEFTDTDSVR